MKREEIVNTRIIRDKKGNSKGFAYVDFSCAENAQKGLVINNLKMLNDQKLYVAISDPPKLGKKDECTLFLNNLPFEVSENDIKNEFGTLVNLI